MTQYSIHMGRSSFVSFVVFLDLIPNLDKFLGDIETDIKDKN